jgi:inorganic phosphate transporter, PiT family
MIEILIYGVGIVLSFYMAWCMGANDAANPTECAVGAGAISMKKALVLFAIFAAIGGITLGPLVMKTVDRGLVSKESLSTSVIAVGSFTAVAAAGIWVTFCTWLGMPISTSHSIVGGIIGFGLVAGPSLLRTENLSIVLLSFLASPVLALILAIVLFFVFQAYFGKIRSNKNNIAVVFLSIFGLSFATIFSIFAQILRMESTTAVIDSFFISFIISTSTTFLFRKKYGDFTASRSLGYLILISLCFSALSFGANDMANATGVFVTPTERLMGAPGPSTMVLLALLGAIGIAVGGFTWGYKVISVSAYQVTRINLLNGAAAGYSNAITVFLFTVVPNFIMGFGMPISTTQAAIGSLIGVGLAGKGLTGVSKKTIGKIFGFWILTIPATILISMVLFWLISHLVVMV